MDPKEAALTADGGDGGEHGADAAVRKEVLEVFTGKQPSVTAGSEDASSSKKRDFDAAGFADSAVLDDVEDMRGSASGGNFFSNSVLGINPSRNQKKAYVPEAATVEISRSMLEHLKPSSGSVSNIFIASVISSNNRHGVFHALHVVKTLLEDDFKFAVNQTSDLEVFVVPSTAANIEKLKASLPRTFKFDDHYVKFKKVGRLELMDSKDDVLYKKDVDYFPAIYGDLNNREVPDAEGYPRGYSDCTEPMERHRNPRLSQTTMNLLGIHEGETEGLLKVNIKYMLSADCFEHVYYAVPWKSEFKDAVDQDGYLYLKFDVRSRAKFLSDTHMYVDSKMIKYYSIDSVAMENSYYDKAKLHPVYWRANKEDDWLVVEA